MYFRAIWCDMSVNIKCIIAQTRDVNTPGLGLDGTMGSPRPH